MDMMEELKMKHIHIQDPERVHNIVTNMMQDGPDKLQVVADFDRTLSKSTEKGVMCASCHNVLEEGHVLPDLYKEKARKLRDHYYAIEVNHNMTIEEKIPHMVEWWTKAHDLLLQFPITREAVAQMVRNSTARLRDNSQWLFNKLHENEIPVLIFSAGIGDVLEEVIRQQASMYRNMKIVSNYIQYNSQGQAEGFEGEMIHVFNKNENAIHQSDYFPTLRDRVNVLLMGDSLGDLHMAEGVTQVDNMLKIGFLNGKVEEHLETYKKNFDIVIVQDETMDIVNSIVRKILERKPLLEVGAK